jgi:GNAT superfamily N-acetyltransferase
MRVRRAVEGDEEVVRSIRLRSLNDAPEAFESTLEVEQALGPEDWRKRLSNGATFLLERPGDPVGIAAGIPHWKVEEIVVLVGLWVAPEARGTGGGDALVQAVISWAEAGGASEVRLEVGLYNERARQLYERNGFRVTGREYIRERDGVVEAEMACPLARGRDSH